MRFSIVIPTYNRRETLEVVLPSLTTEQNFPDDQYEVLLCDAGSEDGTRELVESLGVDNVKFLPGPNTGRSGARNRGILAAQGEIVLFTDADIIADPALLSEHDLYHRRYPACAVVGNEVQVDSLAHYEYCRMNPQDFARHSPQREFLPWHYFLTGNASVDRVLLLELEGFDENFQGYGHEDLELGYRILKAGYKIRYNPLAINYHWHPVGYEEQCEKNRLAGRSTVRFYRKHKDWRVAVQMGWNPVSWVAHSIVKGVPRLKSFLESEADKGRGWAQKLMLQYWVVEGIKEAYYGQA